MLISLFELSSADGKSIQEEVPFGLDEITFRMGSFPILKKDPIRLEITNTGDKVLEFHVQGQITAAIPCDRCLDEVPTEITFDTEGKLDMKLTEEEREEEKNEYSCLNGTDLDVDRLQRNLQPMWEKPERGSLRLRRGTKGSPHGRDQRYISKI